MTVPAGATLGDWNHFDLVLGLGADVLPVIPDPNAPKSEFTKVKKFGKIPSEFNGDGGAHGIVGWSKLAITPAMVTAWSKDRRYSLCVRASAVRAIDVDIKDPGEAAEAASVVSAVLSPYDISLPRRERANSSKFLLAFKLAGAHKKRIITLAPGGAKAPRIEFLGDGEQFLVAGAHESGALYQWVGGLPADIPTLSLNQFEEVWQALDTRFALMPTSQRFQKTTTHIVTDLVGDIVSPNPPTELVLSEISDAALGQLGAALAYEPLIKAATDNSVWSEVGYALLSLKVQGLRLFEAFSNCHAMEAGFEPNAARDWWEAHAASEPRCDYRHIFTLARQLKWRATAEAEDFPVVEPTLQERATDAGIRSSVEADTTAGISKRATLRLQEGQLHVYAREAEQILSPDLYTQGGALVRIGESKEVEGDSVCRDSNQRSLVRVTSEYVRRKLTAVADVVKYSKQQECWVPVNCPTDLAENIMGQRDWPNLRTLDAIVRAPFIRVDGSVCDVPGYDARSGAFYIPNAVYPQLTERPTRNDAMAALERLLHPFAQFPYASGAARSAFAAHILTEAARLAISNAPMFWYTAPNAGTGKTLLSEIAATIVHGSTPALRPWVDDAEEIRKTLFSSLLAGDRSIAFDNVPNGYKARSAALCAFLTAGPLWQDRKLGVSETISVRNRAVVSASGNNVTPVSDMARRSLVIRLDASVTSKELRKRTFDISNLRGYVLANRVELLMAALTIIKAHQGQPPGPTPLPSFEDWSRLVRDPLLWLGMEDPVLSQDDETDDESGSLDKVFSVLAPAIGNREFTVRDLVSLATSFPSDELSSALMSAGCNELHNSVKVGFWLRDCRDKVGGGYKLEFVKSGHAGVKMWRFRNLGNGDLT